MRCDNCLEDLPLDSFKDITRGHICDSCRTGISMRKTEDALAEKAKHIAGQLASLDPDAIGGETGKVRNILADLYRNFGGTSGFAQHLHHVLMELSRRRPVPAAAGQILVNLMKLHHTIEQAEEEQHARDMSDEQLEKAHRMELNRMFMQALADPEQRKTLDLWLGREGLSIEQADPAKLIQTVNDRLEESSQPKLEEMPDIPAKGVAGSEATDLSGLEDSELEAFLKESL